MSLINKALKKAQNQSGDPSQSATPGFPPASGPSLERTGSPAVPWLPIMVVLATMVVFLGGILAVLLFWVYSQRSDSVAGSPPSPPVEQVERISPSAPSRAAPSPPAPAEREMAVPELPVLPTAAVAPSAGSLPTPPVPPPPAPAAPVPAPEPVASLPEPPPAPPAPVAPALSAEAAERIETVAAAEQQPDPRIVEWLAGVTVNGVRIAGQNSRLSMNNRNFRIGDAVHFELGLVLRAVQEERVLFEDARGVRYVIHF